MHDTISIAMVTFERTDQPNRILADDLKGAVGWMAVDTDSEETARRLITEALEAHDLRFVELERFQTVGDVEDISRFDEHLFDNVRGWEQNKRTVWGTIHVYTAD